MNAVSSLWKSHLVYESRPWIALGAGIYGLVQLPHTALTVLSGVTLIICGALTLHWRRQSRSL